MVTEFDDKLKQLATDMAETMYKAPGVGLAATQVDRHIRLIVIDITEEKNDLKVLVNPELVESSEETKLGKRAAYLCPAFTTRSLARQK